MADNEKTKETAVAPNHVSSKSSSDDYAGSSRHNGEHSSGGHHHSGEHSSGKHDTGAEKAARNRYRKIISYTFSFILSLFLLLGTVCVVALTCLFSEGFFFSVINDDYYAAVLSDVITEAEDYTIPAEFDVSVLDGVFTVADVKHDVNGHVTAAFRGYSYTPDMETENNKLYANVAAYIAESGVKVEGDADTVIAAYIVEIDKIYLERVRLPGINLIKVAREKIKGVVTFALIVLFALSLILIVVLLKLYRYPHKGLRYVSYAAGGCTLMSFVLPFILYLSKVYAHVQVSPEYFYHFVTNYLRQILFSFMQAALIWLVLNIVCIVFIYLSKNGMLNGKIEKKIKKKLMSSRR